MPTATAAGSSISSSISRRPRGRGARAPIDVAFVEATIARSLRRFDKGGEAFYDQISALHKSVRGSNPDAALYWMCRMLDGGADPLYVGRRLIRMATEDIGLADPRALSLTHGGRRDLRAARHAGGRARAGRSGDLSRLRGQVERGVRGVQRGARVHRRGRLAAGAAAAAQCADEADEGPGLRQGLPLRARRGRTRSPRASATFPTTCRTCRGTSRPIAGSRRRSARSSNGCARRIARRATRED